MPLVGEGFPLLSILVCHSYFLRFDEKQRRTRETLSAARDAAGCLAAARGRPPRDLLRRHAGRRRRGLPRQASRRAPRRRRVLRGQLQLPEQDVPRQDARRLLRDDRGRALRRCARRRRGLRCLGRAGALSRGRRRCRVARRGSRGADGARGPARRTTSRCPCRGSSRDCPTSARRSTGRTLRSSPAAPLPEPELPKRPARDLIDIERVSRRLARRARLLQPQHGGIARLLVPLRLVREADLGQSLPAAGRGRRRRRNAEPEARLRARPRLVCRRHLRLPRRIGSATSRRCSRPAEAACRSRSSFARTW